MQNEKMELLNNLIGIFFPFHSDIGYPNGWEMRKDTLPYTDFTAPGVEMHCLYGEGFPTVERFS